MAAAGTLPGLRPPGARPTGPITQQMPALSSGRRVIPVRQEASGGQGSGVNVVKEVVSEVFSPIGGTPVRRPGQSADPRVMYNTDGSVREAWIGQGRAVGQVRMNPNQRAAFNPMGDQRIRDAYNPMANPAIRGAYNGAGDLYNSGTQGRGGIEDLLAQGFSAPVAASLQTVNPVNPLANTSASSAGLDRAVGYLGNTQDSRNAQSGVQQTALDWAQGNMPSVGQNLANEAGVRANEQFLRAGSEANQAYGSAASRAAQAYADSQAAQNEATRMAGVSSARQVGDAASDSVLRAAALSSGARGGNIGMALRTGLQGQAMQSADANRQGARLMSDANAQASYNATAGQRAAQAAAAQGNLATQGTQERTASAAAAAEAAARFQAAQIGSQEQQNMLGLAQQGADAMRSGDVASANAATGLANTGVNVDQMVNAANQMNADRSFNADTFNSTQSLQNQQFGQGLGLNYDQLNSQTWNNQANRFQGDQQFGLGMQAGIGQFDSGAQQALAAAQMGSQQDLAQFLAGLDENSRQRLLQDYGIRSGVTGAAAANATATRGQMIGLGGAGVAAGGAALAAYLGNRGGGGA